MVDRGCVQGYLIDLLPGIGLFAPDDDFSVIRRRGENVSIFRMCPGDAPNSTLVSNELSTSGNLAKCPTMTYPRRVSTNVCFSPSTSKILIVLSEEHVANRLP